MKVKVYEVTVTLVVEIDGEEERSQEDLERVLAQQFMDVFDQLNGKGLNEDQYHLIEEREE